MEKQLCLRNPLQNDPALFMQRYTPPVIIDEIQYAPEILPYVKMSADNSNRKGDFWLAGSQMFHMMKNVSESLAGRVGIVNLLGLSNNEINNTISEPFTTSSERLMARIGNVNKMGLLEIYSRIFKGSMPALYGDEQPELEDFYRSHIIELVQPYHNNVLKRVIKSPILHFLDTGLCASLLEQYKVNIGEGAVVCMADDLMPIDTKNWYVPVWMI